VGLRFLVYCDCVVVFLILFIVYKGCSHAGNGTSCQAGLKPQSVTPHQSLNHWQTHENSISIPFLCQYRASFCQFVSIIFLFIFISLSLGITKSQFQFLNRGQSYRQRVSPKFATITKHRQSERLKHHSQLSACPLDIQNCCILK